MRVKDTQNRKCNRKKDREFSISYVKASEATWALSNTESNSHSFFFFLPMALLSK